MATPPPPRPRGPLEVAAYVAGGCLLLLLLGLGLLALTCGGLTR